MRVGFIGTGTITSAIVTGMRAAGNTDVIVLSPRNAQTASDLASRFAGVRVAADNQAVLDSCDLAVLAFRPQIAVDVLKPLRFRPDHQVLSLVATFSLAELTALTAPASEITRAVPIPSVARLQGPTAIYPPNLRIKALFGPLGTAIELDAEDQFDVFTAGTAVMASYFAFAASIQGWMVRQGVLAASAHAFTSEMLQGLAGATSEAPHLSFADLVDEHQTMGGLNEQVRKSLEDDGLYAAMTGALDGVLGRVKAGAASRG